MQSFSDDPLTDCQVCGAPVQKVFHPVSVHFKGSGFHNTDYGTRRRAREKEREKAASSEGGSTSKSESSSGGSSASGSSSSEGKAAAA